MLRDGWCADVLRPVYPTPGVRVDRTGSLFPDGGPDDLRARAVLAGRTARLKTRSPNPLRSGGTSPMASDPSFKPP